MDKLKELIKQLEEKQKELDPHRINLQASLNDENNSYADKNKIYTTFYKQKGVIDSACSTIKKSILYELNKAFGNDNINFVSIKEVNAFIDMTIYFNEEDYYEYDALINYRELLNNPKIIKNVYNCNLFVNCGNNYNDNKDIPWYIVDNHLTCGECREEEIDILMKVEAYTINCSECSSNLAKYKHRYYGEDYCEDCLRKIVVEDNIMQIKQP
jgi:hypothetical protein